MTERKAVIKNADMSEEMQQDAVDCATQVLPHLFFFKFFDKLAAMATFVMDRKML